METRALNVCRSRPLLEYVENLEEDETPVWTREVEYEYHKRLLTCFCDELKIVSKELMSGVRQATKDVVKSEV